MKKMNILRGIALLLAAIMIFTSIPETALTAYAIEEEAGTETPAAVEPTVEQAGTGEEAQVTTPEAVEPETTDDVVIDPVASDAPEATGEEIGFVGATANPRPFDVSSASLTGLQMGTAISDTDFNVTASYYAEGGLKFEYGWYKLKDNVLFPDGGTTQAKYNSLTDATADIADLGFTTTAGEAKITISGTPNKYVDKTFYLVVADKCDDYVLDENTTYTAADYVFVPVQISVNKASVISDKASIDYNDGAANFYEGYTADTSNTVNNVTPAEITLTASGLGDNGSIPASDVVCKVYDGGTEDTTGTYVVTVGTNAMSSAKSDGTAAVPLKLSVAPKTGLIDNNNLNNNGTTFARTLKISSKGGNFEDVSVNLSFVVKSALLNGAFTYKQLDADGSTLDGSSGHEFEATKGVALANPITITKTGVNITDMKVTDPSKLPKGLEYTWAKTTKDGVDTAVLTISGTVAADVDVSAYNLGSNSFTVTVTSGTGTSSKSVESDAKDITLALADLTYAVGGEEINNAYAWTAAYTNAANNTYNTSVSIVLTNPTSFEQKVEVSVGSPTRTTDADSKKGSNFQIKSGTKGENVAAANATPEFHQYVTLKAGATATVVIEPKTGKTYDADTPSNNTYTEDVVFAPTQSSGNDIANSKTVALTLTMIPNGTSTISYPTGTLKDGTVGKAYEDAPVLAGSSVSGSWELVAKGDKDGHTTGHGISAANLLKNYGLTFNTANGKITGTPTNAGTITLEIKCTYGSSKSVSTGEVTLTIAKAKADDVIKVVKGETEITEVYDAGSMSTSDNSVTLSFDVANISAVELKGLTAEISTLTRNEGAVGASDIDDYFTAAGLDEGDIAAGGAKAISITTARNIAAGTYVGTVSIDDDDADNTDAIPNNIDPAKTFTFKLVVAAAPVITYTATTGATDEGPNSDGTPYAEPATLNVGDELKEDTTGYHAFTVDNASTRSMTWSIASGELPTGLYLNSKGQIYGTATSAGTYKVQVRGYDTKSGYAGYFWLRMSVAGSSEIASVTFTEGTSEISLLNNEYIFDYSFAGKEAPDDLEVIVKSNDNPIKGNVYVTISNSHFKSNYTRINGLDKDGEKLIFSALPTATAGEYDALVTLDGDEIAPVYFWLHHSVVGELKISNWYNTTDKKTVDTYEGKVGEELVYTNSKDGEEYPVYAVATAGNVDNYSYYTTDPVSHERVLNYTNRYPITITEVVGQNTTTNRPDGVGAPVSYKGYSNSVMSTQIYAAGETPTEAGEFVLTFKASAPAVDSENNALIQPINYDADGGAEGAIQIANSKYKLYPKQETTENAVVTFNIAKGDLVQISKIESTGTDYITVTSTKGVKYDSTTTPKYAPADAVLGDEISDLNDAFFGIDDWTYTKAADEKITFPANLDASFDRNGTMTAIKGYNFVEKSEGYSAETLKVYVQSKTTGTNYDVFPTLASGTNFTIAGLTNNKISAQDDGSTYFTVAPKANLAAGTYTDTVKITNSNGDDVEFAVSFTVDAADYSMTVKSTDMLAEDSTTGTNKVNTLITAGKAGAVATTAKMYAKLSAADTQLKIFVSNAGNESVTYSAYEVADSNGTEFPGNSSNYKLRFDDAGDGAGNTAGVDTKFIDVHAETDGSKSFCVMPNDYTTEVTKTPVTAYIKIVATNTADATKSDYVIVPVSYIIYKASITPVYTVVENDYVDLQTSTIELKDELNETNAANTTQINYREAVIQVKNPETTANDATKVYGLTATLTGDVDAFVLACKSSSSDWVSASRFNELPANATKSFSIKPATGLKAGTYEATLTITGSNLNANKEYTITHTVNTAADGSENEDVAFDAFTKYNASDANYVAPEILKANAGAKAIEMYTVGASEAERLWNTFAATDCAGLINTANNVEGTADDITVTVASGFTATENTSTPATAQVTVGSPNSGLYTIDFSFVPKTGTWDGDPVIGEADIASATITKASNTAYKELVITIPDTLSTKITGMLNASDYPAIYAEADTTGITNPSSSNLKEYKNGEYVATTDTTVVANKTYYNEDPTTDAYYCYYTGTITITPYSWLCLDASENGGAFTGTKKSIEKDNVITDAKKDTDNPTKVYVLLNPDQSVKDVIKTTLPIAAKVGASFKDWGAATNTETSKIAKDTTWEADYDTFAWPAYDAEEGITWTWNASNDGATVTLTVVSEDAKPQTATLTGTFGSEDGDLKVTRIAQDPSCEFGYGYLYAAEVRLSSKWYVNDTTGNTFQRYTDTKLTGEEEGALGHIWNYEDIYVKSVDSTGKVTLNSDKATCDRLGCDEEKAVTYTIKDQIIDPTCTAAGTHLYWVSYYKLDKTGNSTSTVATTNTHYATVQGNRVYYDYKIDLPAKGHTYTTLNVDWDYDAETGAIKGIKNAYVICDDCGERKEVTATYTAYKESVGYALAEATIGTTKLEAKGYPVLDKDCTFSEPTWAWNDAYTVATATFTRSYQGKVLDTKTYSATSTPAVKIDRTVAQLYTVYTATVEINDKVYTSTIKDKRADVYASENGAEDGYIEFYFAGYSYGDDVHYTYTGAKITPRVIVVNGSKRLTEGVDYTVTYKNNTKASVNTKAGVATATIKGKGNYTGTDSTLTFIIDPVDISDEDLVHVSGNAGVAGKAIKPILTFGGKALGAKDSDIAAQFKALGKLTAAADGKTVTVTGKGNFKGTLDVEVSVLTKAELIPIKVASMTLKSTPYTGEPITLDSDQDSDTVNLKVVAKTTGETLYENDNYTVSYSNNVNAGTVKVVIAGIAPYTGKITKSFKITPAKAANLVVENRENLTGSFKRTGATPSEALEIVDETNNIGLVNGRDYTIKYKNNKKVGTATAVVTYKGNYKGHAKDNVTFTVTPAVFNKNGVDEETTIQSKVVWNTTKATAKGKYFTPAPQIMIDGVLLTSKEYTAVYTDADTGAVITAKTVLSMPTAEKPINVNVTVTPKSTNYTTDGYDPIVLSYQIVAPSGIALNGAKLAVMTTNAKGKTVKLNAGYTGEPITFWSDDVNSQGFLQLTIGKGKSATVLTGAQIEDKFDIQYVNNVQKGTATVIITPNDETYSGSVVGTFKIKAGLINWIKK